LLGALAGRIVRDAPQQNAFPLGSGTSITRVKVTIGQYVFAFAAYGAVVVTAFTLARRRSLVALVATASFIAALASAYLWNRDAHLGSTTATRSVIVAIAALAVGALIVFLRFHGPKRRSQVVTGILAWLGLGFAWFEVAYLLR
jgi:hypothetical protein